MTVETSAELFGPLIAPINVEEAVITTLRRWLEAYLAAVEEKNGLPHKSLGRPPTPGSYHGGLDWESEQQDRTPEVIVITNPVGEPERQSESYIQDFDVQVGCVIDATVEPVEQTARRTAGLWAAAVMGAIEHHAGLGYPQVEHTILTAAPKVEFLEPENRRLAVGVTGFHVFVELLDSTAGPQTLKEVEPEGPYVGNPEITTTTETVKAVPVSEAV